MEHILPFSRTRDNKRNNKTIAHRSCNSVKGNHSPFEAFGSSPAGFDWEDILARIQKLPANKRWRFRQDAMKRYEDQEGDFLQRQFTDNAYIAKTARRYLTTICPSNKVWGVTGYHTAILRGSWNLNAILSKDKRGKNRSDHRHHAIDAAVIALTGRSLVKKIAVNNRQERDRTGFPFRVPDFPDGEKGYERLKTMVKNILPSFKPDHGIQGRLFKETAYGRVCKALLFDTESLTNDQVEDIVPSRIREQFESLIAEDGFKKARGKLKDEYPQVRVLTSLWATRKPLTDPKIGDLNPPEKNKKNTKGPVDFGLRKRLREYPQTHADDSDTKSHKALHELYEREHGARHVRYIPKNQRITPIKSSEDKEYEDCKGNKKGKGYELGGFAYVDIWHLPAGHGLEYQGTFVSYLEANRIAQSLAAQKRPHPRREENDAAVQAGLHYLPERY